MVVTRSTKVVKLEEILTKATEEPKPEKVSDEPKPEQKPKKKPKVESSIIKGKPKSGRIWKSERKRFSSIVKTKGIRNSFERKQALRQELSRIKEASKAAKEAKVAQKELKKERRRENMKRQEENRKKSEVVQVIRNTSKIKKMKKKQLRYIEKRDTTNMV